MHERRAQVRRTRIVFAVATVVALVASGSVAVIAQFLQWDGILTPGPGWDDRYTIEEVEVHGRLDDNGVLHVTEDYTVAWHEPRRGLIRRVEADSPGIGRASVDNINVESDTQADVWFEVQGFGDPEIHLGEEFDYRPIGVDHYRVSYELDGLLVNFDGQPTVRWDTFGFEWDTIIEHAEVTLEMPVEVVSYGCARGSEGEAYACDGDGPTFAAQDLRPGRGMTVEAQLVDVPAGGADQISTAPDMNELERFDMSAWRRLATVVGVVALPAMPLVGSFGASATRRRRRRAAERVESTGVAYVPPTDLSPVAAAMLAKGQANGPNDGHLFAAWMVDAQRRELIRVEETTGLTNKGYRVASTGTGTAASDEEAALLQALVRDAAGWNEWNSRTSDRDARALQSAWRKYKRAQQKLAGVPGSVTGTPDALVGVLLLAGIGGGIAALQWETLVGVLLIIGAIITFIMHGWTNRKLRYPVGRLEEDQVQRWRELEGVRRFLEEAHADQISWVQDNPAIDMTDPYLELLPWVIAMGQGEEWTKRFPRQMAQVTHSTGFFAPMTASQISSVRSASTPSSSSSGGGASSGGGSGGGGGGGSSR